MAGGCVMNQFKHDPSMSYRWPNELEHLIAKHERQELRPDVANMTLIEVWQLYQWLKNKAQ